jgi:copper transport protein
VVLAWLQLGSFAALAGSSYGRVLLAKIGLVLGLIALAAVNRLRHLPRLRRDGQAPRRLQRLILLEIGIALLVIAITAALGQLVPPRALHHAATGVGEHRAVTQTVLAASGRRAELALDPGRRGTNSLTVTLTTPDGAALPVLELVARVANPALGIEPHAYALALRSPGRYAIQDVQMSAAGTWRITLDATIGEFESERFDATFVLR